MTQTYGYHIYLKMEETKIFKKLFPVGLLILAVAFIWYLVFYFTAHRNLAVAFFDVGQGDSVFIESANGHQILVDGGPDRTILSKLGRELPFWDRTLDLLILTHPHADHLDGLIDVLQKYKVDAILEPGVEYPTADYQEWKKVLRGKKVPVITARAGQRVELSQGAEIEIIYPLDDFSGASLKNPHDANIVTRLTYGQASVLLMGDAEKLAEYQLMFQTPEKLPSRILKIGHHGSKTSSSEEFLRAVSPELAVISVGAKNRYGHPHQETLDMLGKLGLKYFRTDLDGDVKIESDGNNFTVRH